MLNEQPFFDEPVTHEVPHPCGAIRCALDEDVFRVTLITKYRVNTALTIPFNSGKIRIAADFFRHEYDYAASRLLVCAFALASQFARQSEREKLFSNMGKPLFDDAFANWCENAALLSELEFDAIENPFSERA